MGVAKFTRSNCYPQVGGRQCYVCMFFKVLPVFLWRFVGFAKMTNKVTSFGKYPITKLTHVILPYVDKNQFCSYNSLPDWFFCAVLIKTTQMLGRTRPNYRSGPLFYCIFTRCGCIILTILNQFSLQGPSIVLSLKSTFPREIRWPSLLCGRKQHICNSITPILTMWSTQMPCMCLPGVFYVLLQKPKVNGRATFLQITIG